MKRKAGALALLAALSGCMSADKMGQAPCHSGHCDSRPPMGTVAGAQGPHGEPVTITAGLKPKVATEKRSGVVQASATAPANKKDDGIIQAAHRAGSPQAQGMPAAPPGVVAAMGALPGIPVMGAGMNAAGAARTSIRFTSPAGMQIGWFAPSPEGRNGFTPTQLEVPGRYNFVQGGIYRLRLTNIPNRPAKEFYPTLQIMPATCRTVTFLAHSAVPISFTEEDFEQIDAGNLVIKVVYLPDPQFQDLAVAGPDEVVSTRLEPGVDPILEAQRRGSVLAVVRIGNIDLEAPNTPAMNAPPQGGPFQGMPLMTAPGSVPPGAMPPGGPLPGTVPPGSVPPGSVPPGTLPPGALPPGSMPRGAVPQGTLSVPMPMSANPNAGRSSVNMPATVPMPSGSGAATPMPGNVSVSVEGMVGRVK